MTHRLWLVVAVLALSLGWAATADTVFIATHPYKGPVLRKEGRLLLPLASYVKSMGLQAHQKGHAWCLTDPWHPDTNCPLTEASEPTLYVNGHLVANALVQDGGQTWVDAKATTTAMGGYFKVDTALGMVDMGLAYTGKAPDRPVVAANSGPTASDVVVLHFFAHW